MQCCNDGCSGDEAGGGGGNDRGDDGSGSVNVWYEERGISEPKIIRNLKTQTLREFKFCKNIINKVNVF